MFIACKIICMQNTAARHDRENAESLTLSNTERWVLREVLSAAPHSSPLELTQYFIRKCRKNDVPKGRCAYLIDAFDLDVGHTAEELVYLYW